MIKTIWKLWKKFGFLIASIVSYILTILFYFIIITPFGIIIKIFTDYFHIKNKNSMWLKKETKDKTLSDMRRQF